MTRTRCTVALAVLLVTSCDEKTSSAPTAGEEAKPTKETDQSEPSKPAQPKNETKPPEIDCSKVLPKDTALKICGPAVAKHEIKYRAEVQSCTLHISNKEHYGYHLSVSIQFVATGPGARLLAGNPEPGNVKTTSKTVREHTTKTKSGMSKGNWAITAGTEVYKTNAPLCTQEQLETIVKGIYDRIP